MATEQTSGTGPPRAVITKHGDWLAGLRLVSRAEGWLAMACAVGSVVTLIVTVPAGGADGMRPALALAALSHLLWGFAITLLAPRTRVAALLALTALSLLNLLVAMLARIPGLGAIAWVYALSGLAALVLGLWGLARLGAQWRRLGTYDTTDDFRWLVTRGSLALRWRVERAVRSLPRHG